MRFDYPDQFLTIDDLVVRYWDQGRGEPLLLIHGMGVCLEAWAWNIDALATKYRVIAPDLPGSGKSSRPVRPDVFSLRYSGEFLRRFIEALGISTLGLAGNSMGGVLAIQFALMYPEIVRRLILVDAGGLGKEVHWAVRAASLPIPTQLAEHPPSWLIRLAANEMVLRHDASSEDFVRRVIEYTQVAGTGTAVLRMVRTGIDLQGQTAPFSAAALGKIQAPTLVIWGDADTLIPVEHAEVALHAIPDCRAVVMSHAGHGPQIDRPEVFNELVLEFLVTGRLAQEAHEGKQLIRL
jgi:pimeloyl-ACP methyl ester carboxylesterase